jgi:hypothetical protein
LRLDDLGEELAKNITLNTVLKELVLQTNRIGRSGKEILSAVVEVGESKHYKFNYNSNYTFI